MLMTFLDRYMHWRDLARECHGSICLPPAAFHGLHQLTYTLRKIVAKQGQMQQTAPHICTFRMACRQSPILEERDEALT